VLAESMSLPLARAPEAARVRLLFPHAHRHARPAVRRLQARRPRNCTAPSRLPHDLAVEQPSGAFSRVIWLYWAQGWSKAPKLALACANSWALRNPTWTVRRLDAGSLPQLNLTLGAYEHLPAWNSPHYADLVRYGTSAAGRERALRSRAPPVHVPSMCSLTR
jgi:hypothetical protein